MSAVPHLPASVDNCHWGFFDATLQPALTVESGQRFTIATVSGGAAVLPPAGFHVPPELLDIHARLPMAMPGHILTGPVAVAGALPGDTLEVRIIDVQLRQPDGWTTSLPAGQFSSADVIALYADHGTHEQFHSEFKTDLDLTRLPSGKFDTNYLVCQLAAVAMNILRLIGQRGLLGPDAPVRHPAKRRRLKTVIQELIYRAGRLISTGRKLILGLGANDRSAKAFARLHGELFAAST